MSSTLCCAPLQGLATLASNVVLGSFDKLSRPMTFENTQLRSKVVDARIMEDVPIHVEGVRTDLSAPKVESTDDATSTNRQASSFSLSSEDNADIPAQTLPESFWKAPSENSVTSRKMLEKKNGRRRRFAYRPWKLSEARSDSCQNASSAEKQWANYNADLDDYDVRTAHIRPWVPQCEDAMTRKQIAALRGRIQKGGAPLILKHYIKVIQELEHDLSQPNAQRALPVPLQLVDLADLSHKRTGSSASGISTVSTEAFTEDFPSGDEFEFSENLECDENASHYQVLKHHTGIAVHECGIARIGSMPLVCW